MSDVFISYKSEDRRRLTPLVEALEADGYSVWWDQYIGTGDEWRRTIERELDAARCVVVAWSKRAVGPEGRFVRDEAARAQERGVYVPVLIDAVRIPLGFGESQASSLRGWRGDRADSRYQALRAAIERVAGHAPARVSTKASSSEGLNRRTLVTGGLLAVAAAGASGWAIWRRREAESSDSIAVLPFASLGSDPAQAYFAAGVAGEIRNTLMRVASLKVAGSTSSDAVRSDDARTAAQKLGVANILTGNVRQSEQRIRVTAELIDGETGLAKWSQSYDRSPGDVIAVQSDIAQNVVSALAVALSASVKKALAAGETSNIAAQTLVFQARNLSYTLTVPALRQCLDLLDRAIALDPEYGRAYAIKSFVANNLASRTARSPAEMANFRAQAQGYAEQALAAAPDLPIARSALAFAYSLVLRLPDSIREHKLAVALASGDPDVIRNYGFVLSSIGKPAEALRLVDEARALDPLNWASHYAHATALFSGRHYAETIAYALKIKQESPQLFRFSDLLGQALLLMRREKEAAGIFQSNPAGQALVAARSGDKRQALEKAAALTGDNPQFQGFFGAREYQSYAIARIYAQLGDSNAALTALEKSWEVRDSALIEMKSDPFLDPVRGEARFTTLLQKLGLAA